MAIQTSAQRDLRTSQRYPACFQVKVVQNYRTFPATVKDLSSGGALLEIGTELKAGCLISLTARELEVNAKVVRAAGNTYGVQFSAPIDPLDVIRQNLTGLEHLRRIRPHKPASILP